MTHHITIHCDGLTEPINPGGYGCWAWIATADGNVIAQDYGCTGYGAGMTNNRAEYTAVIQALTYAKAHGWHDMLILTDSKVVVEQTNGRWVCRSATLQPLLEKARRLLAQTGATLEWVPREQNESADALSRVAYDAARAARPGREVQP